MAQNITDKIWSFKELLVKRTLLIKYLIKHKLVIQFRISSCKQPNKPACDGLMFINSLFQI